MGGGGVRGRAAATTRSRSHPACASLQTPTGDARTLLPSGCLLRGQERGASCWSREGRQPAPRLLAAFHPPVHVPGDEGEVCCTLAHPGLVFAYSSAYLCFLINKEFMSWARAQSPLLIE